MSGMINLIKMELFRLVKSKGTYLTILFVVIFSFLLFMMSSSFGEQSKANMLEEDNALYAEITEEEEHIKSGGIGFVGVDFTRDTDIKFETIVHSFLSSGVFLIFCGIFAANTVCNKYKCGFQKNLSTYSNKKWQLTASENIAVLAFTVTEILLIVFILLIISVFYFENFRLGSAANIIKYMGMQAVLYYAFATLIMFIVEVVHSKVAGITVTCLLSMGFGSFFFNKLDEILKLNNFLVTQHTIVYNAKMLPIAFDGELWGTAATVAICSIILYNIFSAFFVSSRDMA